jgi:aspartate/methionine/tyrosine aminotransferase
MPSLDRLDRILPPEVRAVAERSTPIPTIAQRAALIAKDRPEFVRADIGQISSYSPDDEVLYGPPVGLPALREAIAELWTRSFALEPKLRDLNVSVCSGATEGLSLLFRCFARDRAVGLPRGFWENYANGVELAGGRSVLVDYFDADGRLDLAGLHDQIEREHIELLVANFPSNPTGALLDRDECAALAGLLRECDCLCISDEVYARLRYDGKPAMSLLGFAPERVVVVSSASKEYLLPGARVGYVLSVNSDLTDRVLRKLIRANTASPNVLGQRLLLPRLEAELTDLRAGREPQFLGALREELKSRRDALVELLLRRGFRLAGRAGGEAQGTIFLMVHVPKWFSGSAEEFAEAALSAGVCSLVPGDSFGLPETLRFSFGGMTTEQIGALDRGLGGLQAELKRSN